MPTISKLFNESEVGLPNFPFSKEINLTASGKVQVELSLASFCKLARWASLGRTVDDAVEELLENPDSEQGQFMADVLLELKPALMAVHEEIRAKFQAFPTRRGY